MPSRRRAWLWVARIPMPSHSAISSTWSEVSHGRPAMSSTKTDGVSSPSATAVVIMRSQMPEPLPKCLAPVMR